MIKTNLFQIPEAIESLSVSASEIKGHAESSILATEILKNLCFCQANRVLILTSGKLCFIICPCIHILKYELIYLGMLMACFLRLLGHSGPPRVRLVAAALWSLGANHHRSKQALKVAGFQQALTQARQTCNCQETIYALDSALEILTKT